jgi:lipopolysaccharide transport system ATP-binding protein
MSFRKERLLPGRLASSEREQEQEVAIRVSDVSKCYQLYDKPQDRLRQSIYPRFQRMVGTAVRQYAREFWALKDISLQVKKGETFSVIGRNGSGKSTLLQIICGTLAQTTGIVETKGRIGALLELGAGFNPDFTGRENVYMNGAVHGLSKEEIDVRFEEIAAFADIGDFIEYPVKMYSSGMYVRLAFAVQTSITPDVLVVDEALAVGDFQFTRKCLRRIEDLKAKGLSIVFVSHDIALVQKISDRVLYLHQGKIESMGSPATICSRYISSIGTNAMPSSGVTENAPSNASDACNWPIGAIEGSFTRSGTRHVEIVSVVLDTVSAASIINFGETAGVDIDLIVHRSVKNLCVSMYVIDEAGQLLVGTNTNYEGIKFPQMLPGDRVKVCFKFENRLRDGKYGLTTIISDFVSAVNYEYLDYIEPAIVFHVCSDKESVRWAMYTPSFNLRCFINGSLLVT